MRSRSVRDRALVAGAALVVLGVGLTGCERVSQADTGAPAPTASSTPEPAPTATVSVSPASGTSKVAPGTPVVVKAGGGTLEAVQAVTAKGAPVAGAVGTDGSWRSKGYLPFDATIKVTARATNPDGVASTVTSSFTTVTPTDTEKVAISPREGRVVGVGMPVVVTFDHKVTNRAAVEKRLKVESLPMVTGSWNWISSREVQYRPAEFWPGKSKVTIHGDLRGVELAPGIWGAYREPVNFTVGERTVLTVDLAGHTLTYERAGKERKVIPVTNGREGHPTWETRVGTKVIMSQESSRVMDAATTGIPSDDPEYYNLEVEYAMRLTNSGEFIHAAPWSEWAQGKENVSHGCTGLSTADARWLMQNTRVGDPVVVVNGSRPMEPGNGWTLWNKTWPEWQKGSALLNG